MNKNSSIALLGAVLAVSVGLMGTSGIFSMPSGIATTSQSEYDNGGKYLGHLTVIAKDPQGNIKAYRQMDNTVVNTGKICAIASTFTVPAACNNLGFQYIAVGIGSTAEATAQTALVTEQVRTIRTTVTTVNATGTVGAQVVQSATFGFGTNGMSIQESGIFDSAGLGTGHMFSRKLISPTVNVNIGDTLTVTWTITAG